MKHLKKFNEDVDNTLEPQDLLDFSQDLVDAGYTVKFLMPIRNTDTLTNDDNWTWEVTEEY